MHDVTSGDEEDVDTLVDTNIAADTNGHDVTSACMVMRTWTLLIRSLKWTPTFPRKHADTNDSGQESGSEQVEACGLDVQAPKFVNAGYKLVFDIPGI